MEKFVKLKQIRAIMDTLPDTVVITDREGIIRFANQHVTELFGYEAEELIGKEIEILMPERFRKIHKVHVANYFKNPSRNVMSGHRSLKSLKKDGTEFDADISLAPITDGEVMFAFASCRDITLKKSEEKVLIEKARQLEKVNKELEKYGYTISHDLKSPLKKIEALTDLMLSELREGKTVSDIEEISAFLKESVRGMSSLITEVLATAKATSIAEEKPGKEKVSLADLFSDLEKLVVVPENFEINIHCSFKFMVNKKHELLQVLLNLFTNAVKFNDKPKGVIEISCKTLDNHYEFSFKDNGPGIEKEKQKEIFNLFSKGDTGKDSHGIGLYTVKNILKRNGGNISVSSKPGKGAVFTFTWPK